MVQFREVPVSWLLPLSGDLFSARVVVVYRNCTLKQLKDLTKNNNPVAGGGSAREDATGESNRGKACII